MLTVMMDGDLDNAARVRVRVTVRVRLTLGPL